MAANTPKAERNAEDGFRHCKAIRSPYGDYTVNPDTTCDELNNLEMSFFSGIVGYCLAIAIFLFMISPNGLGKYAGNLSTRMEKGSSSSVFDDPEKSNLSDKVKPGLGGRSSSFKNATPRVAFSRCSESLTRFATLPCAASKNMQTWQCLALPKRLCKTIAFPRFCTLSNPLRQLGVSFWRLIPDWFFINFRIEAPIDFVIVFVFPPIFCIGYILFDVLMMLLDAFLIVNSMALLSWAVPSFPTLEHIMLRVDFTLLSFLERFNLVFAIDVRFLYRWWTQFSVILSRFGNWANDLMEANQVTCNGSTQPVSFAGHVLLVCFMVIVIESNFSYALRFSGAERFSKAILGRFNSRSAEKLAFKAAKVIAGKLKILVQIVIISFELSRFLEVPATEDCDKGAEVIGFAPNTDTILSVLTLVLAFFCVPIMLHVILFTFVWGTGLTEADKAELKRQDHQASVGKRTAKRLNRVKPEVKAARIWKQSAGLESEERVEETTQDDDHTSHDAEWLHDRKYYFENKNHEHKQNTVAINDGTFSRDPPPELVE